MQRNLRTVLDEEELRGLRSRANQLIESVDEVNSDWVRQREWIAVPTAPISGYEDTKLQAVIAAMQSYGYNQFLVTETETGAAGDIIYILPSTLEGLRTFSFEFGIFNCLLFPAGFEFAVLSTCRDYDICVGPLDFVETCLGMSLHEARQDFIKYAEEFGIPEDTELFREVLAECNKISADLQSK